jgi:hypothetical protein
MKHYTGTVNTPSKQGNKPSIHVNPLGPENIINCLNIFKNSVRTAKKTQHFTITEISWLMLFKEIIAV